MPRKSDTHVAEVFIEGQPWNIVQSPHAVHDENGQETFYREFFDRRLIVLSVDGKSFAPMATANVYRECIERQRQEEKSVKSKPRRSA